MKTIIMMMVAEVGLSYERRGNESHL